MKAMKEQKKMDARVSVGLEPKFVDIKDSSKDPSLGYVENPKIKS